MYALRTSHLTARTLYHILTALSAVALALGLIGASPVPQGPPVWRDEFDGTMDAAWTWLNANPAGWDLTEVPGFLRIYASAYGTGDENLLLRPGARGNFTIETRLLFEPTADFQFAGLVIYQDTANFLQFGKAFCDVEGTCVGQGLYFDQIQDAGLVGGNYATPYGSGGVYLRLEVKGNEVTASYSEDGQNWLIAGQHVLPEGFQANGVGLTSSQDFWRQGEAIAADFDYFSLTGDTTAMSPIVSDNRVFINPAGLYGTEFWVTPSDDVILRWRWGACAPGLVTAFIGALDESYEFEGTALQGQWSDPQRSPTLTVCSGGERGGWVGWWEYELGTLAIGDYTLHSAVTLTHPVTDGYDYNGDGSPDLYDGARFDTDIVIHVRETLATFVAYVPGAVEGYGWPLGHPISLNVNDGEYVAEATSEQQPGGLARASRVLFETWRGDFYIEAGDHIVMTDTVTGLWKDTVVTNLAVTGFDLAAGTVTGVFDPAYSNGNLSVWLYDLGGPASLDIDGTTWTATFDPLPPGAMGGATQWEADGDGTSIDFQVPNPRFTVFPERNYIEGYEWLPGATLSVSVVGKPECDITYVSPDGNLSSNFPESCLVSIGDTLTMTDGVTTHVHTIQDLTITEVDVDADTVSGTATFDPALYFHTWIYDMEGSDVQPVLAGDQWQVDYRSLGFDVQPGMSGRAEIVDEDSDATAVEWRFSNPTFVVFPEGEWFDARDWPDGATVTISVEGKPGCGTTKESWGGFFNGGFGEGCDVVIGDTVTFTDGVTTRTHTVRDLAVTNVDPVANTVSGTAPIGEVVHVWVHEYGETERQFSVVDGTWLVDFSPFDLVDPMCGRSEIRDEVGNATAVDWCAPSVRLIAFPAADEVMGFGWPEGSQVTLDIDNGAFVQEVTADPSPWDPNEIVAYFHLGIAHDLVAGELVRLTGSGLTEEHMVRNLSVTEVNTGANTVAGTADDGETIDVYTFEQNQQVIQVQPTGGAWLADFNTVGIDLTEGMCGRTDIWDGIGNSTTVDWCGAPQIWGWVYTYDLAAGSWTEGEHNYYFEWTYSVPEPGGGGTFPDPPRTFSVDSTAGLYDGTVILVTGALRARIGENCTAAIEPPVINPGEETRFAWGWQTDWPMTYDEAVAQFASMSVSVHWDGGPAVPMTGSSIVPIGQFGALVCSTTE